MKNSIIDNDFLLGFLENKYKKPYTKKSPFGKVVIIRKRHNKKRKKK